MIHVRSIPPRGGPRLGGQAPTFALLFRLETIPQRMCALGDSSLQNCIFNQKCHRLVPFFLFPLMVCGRGRAGKAPSSGKGGRRPKAALCKGYYSKGWFTFVKFSACQILAPGGRTPCYQLRGAYGMFLLEL